MRRDGEKGVRRIVEFQTNCDSVWDLLSAYADGEATDAERARVELHIDDCPDCSRDLEFMRRTAVMLTTETEVMPPAYLRQAILDATIYKPRWAERVAAALRGATRGQRGWQLGIAGAGALLAFIMFYSRQSAPPVIDAPGDYKLALNPPSSPRANGGPAVTAPSTKPKAEGGAIEKTPSAQPVPVDSPEPGVSNKSSRQEVARGPGHVVIPASNVRPVRVRPIPSDKDNAGGPRLNPDALEMPADMEEMMTVAKSMPTEKGAAEDITRPMETTTVEPAAKPATSGVKIVLASSSQNLDPGTVSSLADLRKDLVRQRNAVLGTTAFKASQRGQLTVGLIRTNF